MPRSMHVTPSDCLEAPPDEPTGIPSHRPSPDSSRYPRMRRLRRVCSSSISLLSSTHTATPPAHMPIYVMIWIVFRFHSRFGARLGGSIASAAGVSPLCEKRRDGVEREIAVLGRALRHNGKPMVPVAAPPTAAAIAFGIFYTWVSFPSIGSCENDPADFFAWRGRRHDQAR